MVPRLCVSHSVCVCASFLRSLKAVVLLASAAKALRVRRRLRLERAAQRIAAAWRLTLRRRRAQRDVGRLRWQQAVAAVRSSSFQALEPLPLTRSRTATEQTPLERLL